MIQPGQLINSLTSDEDLRQELWVHYLEGNSQDSLSDHLQRIVAKTREPEQLRESIHSILMNPMSTPLDEILQSFSNVEQSVICLLVLGYDIAEIASYKGINHVRLRQIISVIRLSPSWEAIKSRRKDGT